MSQLSNAIKVPMIILVIFVHENLNLEHDGYWGLLLASMAYVAVPTFFLISGYYFFYGHELCKEEYLRKIKKRSKTLLVPYLLWNLLPMLNIVAGNVFSILFRGKSSEALQMYFIDLWNKGVWHVWWDMTAGTMPYDSPLWYVRDLMVMCVLSPLAYVFIRYVGRYGVLLLVLLYVLGCKTRIVGLDMAAVTFFILGGYFSMNGARLGSPSLFATRYRYFFVPMMVMGLLLHVLLVDWEYSHVFQMLYIVFGIFACYSLVSLLPEKIMGRMIGMSSAVFFIYALHNTCVLAFCGGLMNRLPLPHAVVIVIVPFVTFGVCYGIYCVMKKLCPPFLAVLCGGRV